MIEGIRTPNITAGTRIDEFIGHEIVGTTRSTRRVPRAAVLGAVEAVTGSFQAGGGVIFTTLAQANGALNYDALKMSWVVLDPTAANNGIYQKQGASGSGSWTRIADLPYSFYRAVNEGAGSANAIVATNGYPVANTDALIIVNVTDTNTDSAVTLALNGGTPLTIKTASGNAPAVGGFTPGMILAGYIEETDFRLLSDQASAAILPSLEAVLAEFRSQYLGAYASAPSTDPNGDALQEGAFYWNTTSKAYFYWDGDSFEAFPVATVADDGVTTAKIADGAVTDAKLDPAGIKSSRINFSQDESDLTSFPFRPVYHRLRETISVKDAGAKGTGAADDDTAAFQEAIAYAQTRRSTIVTVPWHNAGAYYKITAPLVIQKPIRIVGQHPLLTIAQVGMSAGQYMFDVDGVTLGENLEQVIIENMTIRPFLATGIRARGVRLNRVANPVLRNLIIYTPEEGIRLTGDRAYSTMFDNVQIYSASADGFVLNNFNGGGQHEFRKCQFTGCATGFRQYANSVISGVNFYGSAWEGCTQAFDVAGDVRGMNLWGCYSESNGAAGGSTFRFVPDAGKSQRGIVVEGGFFHTDYEAYTFLMGGSGVVSGINVSANHAMNYATALIRNGGNLGYGTVAANYLANTTAAVSNGPISTLSLWANHNNSGAVTA
jgi:hypothetical protein